MKDNVDITQHAYVHLGELEEGVNIDVAIKHVHDGTLEFRSEVILYQTTCPVKTNSFSFTFIKEKYYLHLYPLMYFDFCFILFLLLCQREVLYSDVLTGVILYNDNEVSSFLLFFYLGKMSVCRL